ncbi:MAG TPA: cation:proton antiporter [Vicinamibacterales bacterium]|nr:cation:proton antiporter [Vicinamibacterales bacterium]
MTLIIAILLLLVVSRVAAELAERVGQPAMIGEILAGLILGPALFGLIHESPELTAIADIGLLMLVLLAGMEIELKQLFDAFTGRNLWISIMGFVVPLALGIATGAMLGLDANRTLFVGLCIAITALPVSIRILMDIGRLQTVVGQRIIGAAIANDVLALLVLGVIVNANTTGAGWREMVASAAMPTVKVVVFMAAVLLVGKAINKAAAMAHLDRFRDAIGSRLRVKEPVFALTLLFVIVFAALAEVLGLHFVVGAFFGSVLLNHELLGQQQFEQARKTASAVSMGFLAPLFFASIGLAFDPSGLTDLWLTLGVVTVAFIGKILSGRIGGWLAGMKPAESWALGMGLNGRGIMELVVARIGLSSGLIGSGLFSVLVLMGMVTTIVTPTLLKRAFEAADLEQQRPSRSAASS